MSIFFINIGICISQGSWNLYTFQGDSPIINANSIQFTDMDNGWITCDYGRAFKTKDGGITWNQIENFPDNVDWSSIGFLDADFVNPDIGYLLTKYDYILKTEDGGNTWIIKNTGGYRKEDAFFINENTGWITGEYGEIRKTTDGGNSWNVQKQVGIGDYYKLHFTDVNHGWAIGQPSIYYGETGVLTTTNGGNTWKYMPLPPFEVSSSSKINFIDENIGWVLPLNDRSKVYKTIDGGNSWITVSYLDYLFDDLKFIDSQNGWCIMRRLNDQNEFKESVILTTIDGGLSWSIQDSFKDYQLTNLFMFDSNNGFILGSSMLHTGEKCRLRYNGNSSGTLPYIATDAINNILDFYQVKPDSDYSKTIRLINRGQDDLIINSTNITNNASTAFLMQTSVALPDTLKHNESLNLVVAFHTSSENSIFTGNLIIRSNAANAPELNIQLKAQTTFVNKILEEANYSDNDYLQVSIDRILGKILIKAPNTETKFSKLALYDLNGKQIITAVLPEINSSNLATVDFDPQILVTGLYIVECESNHGLRRIKKVVVE